MTRVISGVILAAAALAAIIWLPNIALRVLACVVAALASYEYFEMTGTNIRAIVLVVALCWVISGSAWPAASVLLSMALLWVAANVLISDHAVQRVSAGLFASVYIGMPLGMLAAVHALLGWRATLLLVGTVVVSDSAQYYSGRLLGRTPLAPAISPKKTIEGAIGGLIVGTAFMVLVGGRVLSSTVAGLVGLGVFVVIVGICGDLFESRLKRTAGIKDSSSLIPGHGGVLDRIDALLFAAVPFYLFVRNIT
ncbi:MAG TPA: phosphatidate cytidylyltransferase [Vicinamibacterales bacterium]|nr:phosphatidate cytidylyltransferase [Vicinamibacterales bacterium]